MAGQPSRLSPPRAGSRPGALSDAGFCNSFCPRIFLVDLLCSRRQIARKFTKFAPRNQKYYEISITSSSGGQKAWMAKASLVPRYALTERTARTAPGWTPLWLPGSIADRTLTWLIGSYTRAVPAIADVSGRWRRLAVPVACIALCVSACGSSSHGNQDEANSSFISAVHDASPDISTYRTDDQLISLGHAVCEGFQGGASYQQLADRLAQLQGSNTLPSQDLGAVIVASVDNFCPKYSAQVS